MHSSLKKFVAAPLAFAMLVSPTMVSAATSLVAPSPLVAVSLYGTQASAQAVCSQGTAAAGAAVAAQGQAGCVLPATDVPPPAIEGAPAAVAPTGNFGINWLLLGLGSLALLAGIRTLFDEDDIDGTPLSPA